MVVCMRSITRLEYWGDGVGLPLSGKGVGGKGQLEQVKKRSTQGNCTGS